MKKTVIGNLLSVIGIFLMVAVIVAGIFYGILEETSMRELKADRMAYNRVLCERALAERAADRDAGR